MSCTPRPNENIAPIRVPNFHPQEEACSFKDEMFKKYIDKLKSEDEQEKEVSKLEITKSVNNFFKKHGTSDWTSNGLGFGQKGGEVASWLTAVVAASFSIAGVVASAASILSIVSPAGWLDFMGFWNCWIC